MTDVSNLKKWIRDGRHAIITTHQNPDADALGTSLALAHYLGQVGLQATVVAPTEYPAFLNWMPGNDKVIVYSNDTEAKVLELFSQSDLIFCVDFNSLSRINQLGEMVSESKAKKILIDHHLSPDPFPDFSYWSTKAAASAELLYELIVLLGDQDKINSDIASCLYAGIMTDTGNFKHPNVTENVFAICAHLVKIGANTGEIARNIYDNNSLDRLRLLGFSLKEKLKILPEYHTAYIALSSKDLYRFNAQSGDTEGLVNYALSIHGVRFAVLFTQKDDIIKMSFRSSGNFSVNTFARENFNGGGHKNAAGGVSHEDLENTLQKFENLLKNYSNELV